MPKESKGYVFNIQHYSIHDGPGIRTTVFMLGCPLRCVWCQNPESQGKKPQLFFTEEKCTGCGECAKACGEKAVKMVNGKPRTDRLLCRGQGRCAAVCPNEARTVMGREMTAEEVFRDVNADAVFYRRSGGGVTLSGGEPLFQPEFTLAVLELCHKAGISTALETCGYTLWEALRTVLPQVNIVLYDFKQMDAAAHQLVTGVSNELVLENARKIVREFPDITFIGRIPVIPGYNDSPENIRAAAEFIRGLGRPIKIHLLPYHRLGETKYERLEKPVMLKIEPPGTEQMEKLRRIVESCGLEAVTGG
jgi:pyruvate formate lyase activating enzyme